MISTLVDRQRSGPKFRPISRATFEEKDALISQIEHLLRLMLIERKIDGFQFNKLRSELDATRNRYQNWLRLTALILREREDEALEEHNRAIAEGV